jgi:hypothetical protein
VTWGVLVAGVLGLAVAFPRIYLRDPAPQAAAYIRADWDSRYRCGPAYVLGFQHAAHGLGLYFGRGVIGASHGDFEHAQWIDHARLRRLGAVVVEYRDETHPRFAAEFPQMTAPTILSLPYRRTGSGAQRSYVYRFVPPEGCPS